MFQFIQKLLQFFYAILPFDERFFADIYRIPEADINLAAVELSSLCSVLFVDPVSCLAGQSL